MPISLALSSPPVCPRVPLPSDPIFRCRQALLARLGLAGQPNATGLLLEAALRGGADGLRRMHAAGIVHRDTHIGNIVLTRSDPARFQWIDFGRAQELSPAECPAAARWCSSSLSRLT